MTCRSSQEYLAIAGVPQGCILGPTLFLVYISDPPDGGICNIAIYVDDTTLCSKCDQASDLWQQLELASDLEYGTVDWGRKWLVDFKKIGALIYSMKLVSPEVVEL